MSDLDVKVNIRCTTKEREKFQRTCRKTGDTPSSVMRRLMLAFTKGEISFNPVQEAK